MSRLPYNDDRENRIMCLIFGIIFLFPTLLFFYCIFFSSVFCQRLQFLLFGLLCGSMSVCALCGFFIQMKDYWHFQSEVWKEEKVMEIMKENEKLLEKAGTAYYLILPGETQPRSLSLGLILAFLLAHLPKQRRMAHGYDNSFSYGMMLFVLYAALGFFGKGLLHAMDPASKCDMVDKLGVTFMFSILFFLWTTSFIQGWRTLHLLRVGKVTGGIVRNHPLTGVFFQYYDEFGNVYWHHLPYSLYKNKKKVTILFDAKRPEKSLILDELLWLKQVRLMKNGKIQLPGWQLYPLLFAGIVLAAAILLMGPDVFVQLIRS